MFNVTNGFMLLKLGLGLAVSACDNLACDTRVCSNLRRFCFVFITALLHQVFVRSADSPVKYCKQSHVEYSCEFFTLEANMLLTIMLLVEEKIIALNAS
jgi:hypothetical protein